MPHFNSVALPFPTPSLLLPFVLLFSAGTRTISLPRHVLRHTACHVMPSWMHNMGRNVQCLSQSQSSSPAMRAGRVLISVDRHLGSYLYEYLIEHPPAEPSTIHIQTARLHRRANQSHSEPVPALVAKCSHDTRPAATLCDTCSSKQDRMQ